MQKKTNYAAIFSGVSMVLILLLGMILITQPTEETPEYPTAEEIVSLIPTNEIVIPEQVDYSDTLNKICDEINCDGNDVEGSLAADVRDEVMDEIEDDLEELIEAITGIDEDYIDVDDVDVKDYEVTTLDEETLEDGDFDVAIKLRIEYSDEDNDDDEIVYVLFLAEVEDFDEVDINAVQEVSRSFEL